MLRIGCDPEFFLRNKKTGLFVSAHNLVPGTKKQPHKYKSGAVQHDGVAAEININPAVSMLQFVQNISQIQTYLENRCPGYELVAEPVAYFESDYFDQLPPAAKLLGCDPDLCAWEGPLGTPNQAPDSGGLPFRTGAGHIHLGWRESDHRVLKDPEHVADCVLMAKQMDYYVGLYTLLYDPDNQRRELYGKAGAFRVKPYGMEYRVPSNVWLKSKALQAWIYRASLAAYSDLKNGVSPVPKHGDLARRLIDEGNRDWLELELNLVPKSVVFPMSEIVKNVAA